MVALKHYEDFVKASIEAGADLIISGAGLPLIFLNMLAEVHKTNTNCFFC